MTKDYDIIVKGFKVFGTAAVFEDMGQVFAGPPPVIVDGRFIGIHEKLTYMHQPNFHGLSFPYC